MPTGPSCYLSITANWAIRKQKVILNITGVILRVLTFPGCSCLGNIFEQCPMVFKISPETAYQPAKLVIRVRIRDRGQKSKKAYHGQKHLKGEAQ